MHCHWHGQRWPWICLWVYTHTAYWCFNMVLIKQNHMVRLVGRTQNKGLSDLPSKFWIPKLIHHYLLIYQRVKFWYLLRQFSDCCSRPRAATHNNMHSAGSSCRQGPAPHPVCWAWAVGPQSSYGYLSWRCMVTTGFLRPHLGQSQGCVSWGTPATTFAATDSWPEINAHLQGKCHPK